MKNAIYYYYQLSTSHVHQTDKKYRFFVGESEYLLTPVDLPLNLIYPLYQLTMQLYQKNIYCHQFIPNKDGELVTYINQVPYVLLRIYYHDKRLITIDDITTFTNQIQYLQVIPELKRNNWYQMWTEKIDYFEYQISQFGKKFPIIRESFSYFVGLSEMAISILNQMPENNSGVLTISRRRITSSDTLFDLYNPLNFIIDYQIRDPSEFFKQKFFENPFVFDDIKYYLESSYLTEQEKLLFFVRMIFPTYYFDLYEDILLDGKDEKLLLKIIEKVDSYQNLLKELYLYLRTSISLPDIEWLIK